MARLTGHEFDQLIEALAAIDGLGKLQDKLTRFNALVSRRRSGGVQALSRQLFQLTGGLERESVATRVVLALWEEFLASKMDEESAKRLENLAEKINGCLTPDLQVDVARESDLRSALLEYRAALAGYVGESAATLTMLNRAVPGVAGILRQL